MTRRNRSIDTSSETGSASKLSNSFDKLKSPTSPSCSVFLHSSILELWLTRCVCWTTLISGLQSYSSPVKSAFMITFVPESLPSPLFFGLLVTISVTRTAMIAHRTEFLLNDIIVTSRYSSLRIFIGWYYASWMIRYQNDNKFVWRVGVFIPSYCSCNVLL